LYKNGVRKELEKICNRKFATFISPFQEISTKMHPSLKPPHCKQLLIKPQQFCTTEEEIFYYIFSLCHNRAEFAIQIKDQYLDGTRGTTKHWRLLPYSFLLSKHVGADN
jgi:hypothetical protein